MDPGLLVIQRRDEHLALKDLNTRVRNAEVAARRLWEQAHCGTKIQVYVGTRSFYKCRGKYLVDADLVMNAQNRLVIRKGRDAAAKNLWIDSVKEAKEELGLIGFHLAKKGSPLYIKANSILKKKKDLARIPAWELPVPVPE